MMLLMLLAENLSIDTSHWEAYAAAFGGFVLAWRIVGHWLDNRIISTLTTRQDAQTKTLQDHSDKKWQEHQDCDDEAFRKFGDEIAGVKGELRAGNARMASLDSRIDRLTMAVHKDVALTGMAADQSHLAAEEARRAKEVLSDSAIRTKEEIDKLHDSVRRRSFVDPQAQPPDEPT